MPIHHVLLNATPVPAELIQAYSMMGAALVPPNVELLRALGHQPRVCDVLGTGPKIRHDAHKLAQAILAMLVETPSSAGQSAPAMITQASAVNAG